MRVSRVLEGQSQGNVKVWTKLLTAVTGLQANRNEQLKLLQPARAECGRIGLRKFARLMGATLGPLSEVLHGKRRMTAQLAEDLGLHSNWTV